MNEKKILHFPEENTNKMLISISDATSERIKRISSEKNLTYTALISLAVELFDNLSEEISIII